MKTKRIVLAIVAIFFMGMFSILHMFHRMESESKGAMAIAVVVLCGVSIAALVIEDEKKK